MAKSKVYFTHEVSPEALIRVYDALGIQLPGKVAVKLHSGEKGNQNYVHPEFVEPLIRHVGGTVVECNTAYGGARNTTEKHKELLKEHGWTRYFDVDLMDADGDFEIAIPSGKVLKKNKLGNDIKLYDSLLVLSHFKGHPMGGFGGALKQLSIGCASSGGKALIHSAGRTDDQYNLWNDLPAQDTFLEAMADAASSVVARFKGKMAYVSMMVNMSVDCDCCAVAEDPCLKDIGLLSSLDPIAIDQACLDLVRASGDEGVAHFMERVTSRHGEHTIEAAEALGFGSRDYELIFLD